MNIDQGRIQRLVSHEIFNGQQVCPIFIKVGAESVAERMTGEPVLPSKGIFMCPHMTANIKSINGAGRIRLFREKPTGWMSVSKPVVREDVQSFLGKDGVAVGTAFGMGDMDPHIFPFDIAVTEVTDFSDPEPGRVHESDHSFWLEVQKSGDKKFRFLLSRDKGKIGIEFAHRELGGIPGFVQDIHGEETELRDTVVDRAVRKGTLFLEPADKIPEFLPGNVFRLFEQDCLKVIQIRADVSRIRFYSVVSKATQGDHLPVKF